MQHPSPNMHGMLNIIKDFTVCAQKTGGAFAPPEGCRMGYLNSWVACAACASFSERMASYQSGFSVW